MATRKRIPWSCPGCGTEGLRTPYNIKKSKTGLCVPCSRLRGPDHPHWKGGEVFNIALERWVVIRDGERILRYRAVMEDHLGRRLGTDEHVHHLNGDSTDDRLENLLLVSPSGHRQHHGGLSPADVELLHALYAAGLSQNEIARRMGITQSSVSRRLRGRKQRVA